MLLSNKIYTGPLEDQVEKYILCRNKNKKQTTRTEYDQNKSEKITWVLMSYPVHTFQYEFKQMETRLFFIFNNSLPNFQRKTKNKTIEIDEKKNSTVNRDPYYKNW